MLEAVSASPAYSASITLFCRKGNVVKSSIVCQVFVLLSLSFAFSFYLSALPSESILLPFAYWPSALDCVSVEHSPTLLSKSLDRQADFSSSNIFRSLRIKKTNIQS